ncbi:hypothetical protein MTP02_02580 [Streptomyces albus]|nr:hypothetical protein MTP02_02580 [Streptomyces albus]
MNSPQIAMTPPQPGAGAEFAPSLDEVPAEGGAALAGGGAGRGGRQAQQDQAEGAEAVGGGVGGEDAAG